MTQSVAQLLLRALQAADIAGLQPVVVHAKNQSARAFYLKYGFGPPPIDDLHLMLHLILFGYSSGPPMKQVSIPNIRPKATTASARSPSTSALWCVPPARE